ncbi:hypothetical protein DXT99_23515 [Pontibacter diazotrophicus]|uniref:Uncharacterized protein n=2 Tax=Pontibacter diazotrophicus TaxID=1400979 RepID=A0A3D8L3F5_9BACT|nr:hypothetical protein DXT99_23515 [Pontibacter diazotrophicus]
MILSVTSCSSVGNEKNPSAYSAIYQSQQEQKYPWDKDVTQAAIEAIHRSVRNIKKPKKEREKNFPADPYSFPFNQTEIKEYEIVGYSNSSVEPGIYQIDFRPTGESRFGPRITVEMNIKTKKASRVYIQADA